MSLGKKLFIGGGGGGTCSTDSVQPFGVDSAYSSNIALYQLDSDGGTTNNVPDTVGNYNGTASNVTYSTGKYGNAAVFNGSSSNITTSGLKGYSKQTWSFWINPDVVNSRGHLMGTYPSGTIGQGAMYVELQSNGNVEAGVRNSSGSTSSVITTTPLTASQWHHIVVTSSGSELKLYINNASPITTSATVTTLDSANVGSLAIGYEQRNNTFYFDGDIDQVRIYDKALSSDEVSILYNETASTASDFNVLDEGSGVALYSLDYDASDAGGNYDGTATDVTFGVDGQINWGASFNGSSSYIDTNLQMPSTTTFTFSCWFYKNDSANYHLIGDFNSTATLSSGRFRVQLTSTDDISVGVGNGTNMDFSVFTPTVSLNQIWRHIAVTVDGTSVKAYIDGSQVGTTDTVQYSLASGVNDFAIGAYNTSSGKQNFNGTIDQVRIFKKAISSNEVDTLYEETACVHTATTDTVGFPSSASSNMFAYYKLDGSGEDESSNNHDGTEGSSMAYSFGRFGTAGSFDGSNNAVITIPDSDKFSPTVNDFSLSFWFNTSSTATNRLIAKGSNPYEWEIWISNGQPVYVGYASGGASHGVLYGGSNPGIYADGNWHHIVVTHDYGTKMEMFVDNVSIGSLTTFTGYGMSNTTSTVTIGKRGDQSTSMIGMLDQIRFYDKILTTDEIEELYNEKQAYITKNASDPFGDNSEVAFYEFENNANDSTGSNDGTPESIFVTYTSGVGLFGTYALYGRGDGGITNTSLGTAFRGQTTLSLSAWFNTENSTYRQTIFSFSDTNDGSTDLWIGIAAGNNTLGFRNVNNGSNNLQVNATGGSSITDGKWHHVVFTADSGGTHIYVDGLELTGFSYSFGNSSTNIVMPNDLNQFNIGVNEDSGGFEWNWNDNHHISGHDGYLDQIRVFNRALDGDEVFKLYAEVIN